LLSTSRSATTFAGIRCRITTAIRTRVITETIVTTIGAGLTEAGAEATVVAGALTETIDVLHMIRITRGVA
jgi:hypothetical protein